jgi:AraC-like DNA-binding protein
METKSKGRPLDRFPIIRTDDVDEMRDAISRFYGELSFSLADGFDGFEAHGNHCQLNDIAISYASYGAAVDHFYPNLSGGYAIPIAAGGSGWGKVAGEVVGVTSRQTLIASPGMPAELHCGPDFEEMCVVLDASAVKQKLASLIGAEVNGSLVFEPVFDFGDPVNRLWWRLLRFLIDEAESRHADLPLTALSEIEQALIVMFLKTNRHNFSHMLDHQIRDVAPRQVRLAEAYIEASWDQPVTVELLAKVTGVSVRSLFHSFRRARGYSPMAFVKQVRLRHARQMLLAPEPRTTVATVAYRCGFGNLGNFARDYLNAFGELPSSTIRTAWGKTLSFAQQSEPA